jgi:hypothetical protein
MTITDINGCELQVTNLHEAIKQAEEFRHYRHEDNSHADFDKRQQAYWADRYHKLIALKNQSSNNPQTAILKTGL